MGNKDSAPSAARSNSASSTMRTVALVFIAAIGVLYMSSQQLGRGASREVAASSLSVDEYRLRPMRGPESSLQRPASAWAYDEAQSTNGWRGRRGQQQQQPCNVTAAAATPAPAVAATTAAASLPPPLIVLGIATAPKNTGHRAWIRKTWMTLPNVRTNKHPAGNSGGDTGNGAAYGVFTTFLMGSLSPSAVAHPEPVRRQLRREQRMHNDILLVNARETKPPGEKMIAFFRWCATSYGPSVQGRDDAADDEAQRNQPGNWEGWSTVIADATASSVGANTAIPRYVTKYCVKTDDDAYVHTTRLEINLAALWSGAGELANTVSTTPLKTSLPGGRGPMQYAGATLWASYVKDKFQVCGHGMGPMMASGQAKAEKCASRGAVGPFPYVAGTLEVLSMPLAEYMVEQYEVNHFVQRAHAMNPPAWDIGEDTVLGMWVHETPFAITALHWGWDKVHDLCFKCTDKTQLWKPITTSSVVVHIKGHQATWHNFDNIHRNFTRVCDDACLKSLLPFDVPNLADLCRRGNIKSTYGKCALV